LARGDGAHTQVLDGQSVDGGAGVDERGVDPLDQTLVLGGVGGGEERHGYSWRSWSGPLATVLRRGPQSRSASGQFLSSAAARLVRVSQDRFPASQRGRALLGLGVGCGAWRGAGLAEELRVTIRWARRDVARLGVVGYQVQPERSAGVVL